MDPVSHSPGLRYSDDATLGFDDVTNSFCDATAMMRAHEKRHLIR